ncbi:MAG: pentapeptide repeat-containing protein, partial [Microcoleus sp. SIO2G3]|nr:pentapeptide repeat-containing protein [Microcoleus sp. SIO2G3]
VSVRHRYQNATEVLRALDLEPYLDSLAQGMVMKPNRSRGSIDSSSNYSELGEITSPSSPSARMAAAIRARNANRGMNSSEATSIHSGPISGRAVPAPSGTDQRGWARSAGVSTAMTSGNSGGSTGKTGTPKLNAEELLVAYAKGKRDFTCHDLSLLSLPRAILSNANFHQSRLHKINLQNANLFSADFGRASLSQAILRNADLARAYLSHADLAGADLRGADLSYAYLSNANLRGANLCGANLTGAKVSDEQLAMARTNWATVHPSGRRGIW